MEKRIDLRIIAGLGAMSLALCPFFWPLCLVPFACYFYLSDKLLEVNGRKQYALLIMLLATSLIAAKYFRGNISTHSILQACCLSLSFVIHAIIKVSLPSRRFGNLQVIVFWFAIQYIFIKFTPGRDLIFLADLAPMPLARFGWNSSLGFLSVSLWIFIINYLIFKAFIEEGKKRWVYWFLVILVAILPIMTVWSNPGLDSSDLVDLYAGKYDTLNTYSQNGELIPRTAAWISVLIIGFALVRMRVQKK